MAERIEINKKKFSFMDHFFRFYDQDLYYGHVTNDYKSQLFVFYFIMR